MERQSLNFTNQANYQSTNDHLNDSGPDLNDGHSDDDQDGEVVEGSCSPAQMWTRKDIQVFKEAIIRDGGDGLIKVRRLTARTQLSLCCR